jgi:hypothetical protein
VTAYNQTVGSLESRVLVSARKLNELGVVDGELTAPTMVEETARALSAPELASGDMEVPAQPVELPDRTAELPDRAAGLMRAAR